jgi:hypothetical protein
MVYFPFAASFYFPWGADLLIFSKFGLGTILILVTPSHHMSPAISFCAVSRHSGCISWSAVAEQAKNLPLIIFARHVA